MTSLHFGFQPNSQSILRSQNFHLAYTVDSQYLRAEIVVEIIAKEIYVKRCAGAFEGDDSKLTGLLFFGRNTKGNVNSAITPNAIIKILITADNNGLSMNVLVVIFLHS